MKKIITCFTHKILCFVYLCALIYNFGCIYKIFKLKIVDTNSTPHPPTPTPPRGYH